MLGMLYGKNGLVPEDIDDADLAPFLYLTMSTLGLIGDDPVVQQYLSVEPDSHRAIRELSAAVAAAGVRVRDTTKHHGFLEEHMNEFTAEEFWMFNLAVDVIAMFATMGGLSPKTRAQLLSDLRTLDYHPNTHHWKHQVKKAGAGPGKFHQLRAHVPQHKPRPA